MNQALPVILGTTLFIYLVYKAYKKRLEAIEKQKILDDMPNPIQQIPKRRSNK